MKKNFSQIRKNTRLLFWILPILLILIPFVFYKALLANEATIWLFNIPEENLLEFDKISTTIQLGLTCATATLLILNLIQQKLEFLDINEASLKANDLQVILFEKKIIDRNLTELKSRNKAQFISYCQNTFNLFLAINRRDGLADSTQLINQIINNPNEYHIDILNHIIQFNNKLTILEDKLSDNKSLYLFIDSIGIELMELLFVMYHKESKEAFNNHNAAYLGIYELEYYKKLEYIINNTSLMNQLINNYFETISIENLSNNLKRNLKEDN
ncbi:MAG: hypothetical protein ACQETL_18415 [Bacteroidota bacterium]